MAVELDLLKSVVLEITHGSVISWRPEATDRRTIDSTPRFSRRVFMRLFTDSTNYSILIRIKMESIGVIGKVLDGDLGVSEFEHQSRYYFHYWVK